MWLRGHWAATRSRGTCPPATRGGAHRGSRRKPQGEGPSAGRRCPQAGARVALLFGSAVLARPQPRVPGQEPRPGPRDGAGAGLRSTARPHPRLRARPPSAPPLAPARTAHPAPGAAGTGTARKRALGSARRPPAPDPVLLPRLPPTSEQPGEAAAVLYWGRGGGGGGRGRAGAGTGYQSRRKKSREPRSRVQAAGSGCPDSSWPRAARSSAESRLLHSCSSRSRAAILSQRPGPRGPRTVQPAAGEAGAGLRELLPAKPGGPAGAPPQGAL